MKKSQFWIVKKTHSAAQYNDSDQYEMFDGNGKQISACKYSIRETLDILAEEHNKSFLQEGSDEG